MLIGIVGSQHKAVIEYLNANSVPGVRLVGAAGAEQWDQVPELDALIGEGWFPTEEQAPRLRWIHLFNAGFDSVPSRVLTSPQWQVTHGGGPSAVGIAEWTLGIMLFFSHRFRDILRYEQERSWYKNRREDMSGFVLRGATVGFLGYGAIARETARLCKAFGMQIHASLGQNEKTQLPTYRTPSTGDPEGRIPDRWFRREDLTSVLPEWDYIALGLRVNDSTRHIINAQTLSYCKKTAILINPARGALIDEAALITALREKQIGGAALDVFEKEPLPSDHPLRDAPNLLISPHCAPESEFYRQEALVYLRENMRRFSVGEPLLNVIQQ